MKLSSENKHLLHNAIVAISVLLMCFVLANGIAQTIPNPPNPPRLVNDYTGTLTEDQQQFLERKLVAFDDSTSTQVAVVIVKSTEGQDVAQYAVDLGRKWGIGGKQFSNGVLLLIAKDDRKINIATGYGVEGALPDITAKHIIDDEIVPNFKGDDYFRGIDEGTDAIMQAVKGEYQIARKKSPRSSGAGIIVLIVVIFILLAIIKGGGGNKGGGYASRKGYRDFLGPFFLGNLLGGGGRNSGGWSGGGGGGWSGGGSGGFGGFGGGSFGGGGASGGW